MLDRGRVTVGPWEGSLECGSFYCLILMLTLQITIIPRSLQKWEPATIILYSHTHTHTHFIYFIIIMIKNITLLIRISPLLAPPSSALFSDKSEILKTYLQIIPPHKVYELREKKEHRFETALLNLQRSLGSEDLKEVLREVKKRSNMIPLPALTRVVELACLHQNSEHGVQLRKAYTKIVRMAREKAEKLPLDELIEMVYKLAKLNRKQLQLMKEVEKVIVQDRIKVDFPTIRKILYSYTHLNVGSAVLYSHISKTLTIGQHQLRPLELAEAAYMLSKVSENAKGGYGVFSLAEQHIEAVLPRMSFPELVKASSFLLIQDLGSNKFQLKLQEALYNSYPAKDKLKITDFVVLLKSTSGYFFKYKENALLSMLKTSTLRLAKYSTVEQFQEIVWSWGRLGKGDKQVWQCLQGQVSKHLGYLKPRQVAFVYYSLCSSAHSSQQLLRKVEERFMSFPLMEINEHYLIKFLLGMQRKKLFDNDIFVKVSEVISKRIEMLSNYEFLTFLKILNESDIDFQTKHRIQGVITSLRSIVKKLESKLYVLKLTEIAELLYLFVKLQIVDDPLTEKCFFNLDTVINIPKSAFIKAFFAFTIKERYSKALQFVPIAEELTKYGPIGYFFSPYEFPLFAYCIFHIAVNGKNITINPQLLRQTQTALKQINPIILNQFVRKGYSQSMVLMDKYYNRD